MFFQVEHVTTFFAFIIPEVDMYLLKVLLEFIDNLFSMNQSFPSESKRLKKFLIVSVECMLWSAYLALIDQLTD